MLGWWGEQGTQEGPLEPAHPATSPWPKGSKAGHVPVRPAPCPRHAVRTSSRGARPGAHTLWSRTGRQTDICSPLNPS